MAEGELLQDEEQRARLVLDDLADHRGLVRLEPVLPLSLPGQEDEAGLVVVVVLDVGAEDHAAVRLAGQAGCRWPPRARSSLATRSTALAVELAASISRPGRLLRSQMRHCALAWGWEMTLVIWSEGDPGPGEEAWRMGMPDLAHDLQVVDLVGEDVDGGRDRALDGVLDGDDGAVDLAGGHRLDGVLHGREGQEAAGAPVRRSSRRWWRAGLPR